MADASAPTFSLASRTVSNTGRPRWVGPPLPGVVPPTILVPYAIACWEWKVPWLPVKPWQMTLVFLSTRMDIVFLLHSARPTTLIDDIFLRREVAGNPIHTSCDFVAGFFDGHIAMRSVFKAILPNPEI